jgi:hypothetical protein
MKVRYIPICYNPNSPACIGFPQETVIQYINENTLSVDGEEYDFDTSSIQFPNISTDTEGIILEAHRDGELYLSIRRFYIENCTDWDTGDYHEING